MMFEQIKTRLFLMKGAGLNRNVNVTIGHVCLKNYYEIKKKFKMLY